MPKKKPFKQPFQLVIEHPTKKFVWKKKKL